MRSSIQMYKANKHDEIPYETIPVTCGLCQFTFERLSKPHSLRLTCPSCGVRFNHVLPEPESLEPKSVGEAIFLRLPVPETEKMFVPLYENVDIAENPFRPNATKLGHHVKAERHSLDESDNLHIHYHYTATTDNPVVSNTRSERPRLRIVSELMNESRKKTFWSLLASRGPFSTFITVMQSIVIGAAIIGLYGFIALIFHDGKQNVVHNDTHEPLEYRIDTAAISLPGVTDNFAGIGITPYISSSSVLDNSNKTAVAQKIQQPQNDVNGISTVELPVAVSQGSNANIDDLFNIDSPDVPLVDSPLDSSLELNLPSTAAAILPDLDTGNTYDVAQSPEVQAELHSKLEETEKKIRELETRYQQTLREQGQFETKSKRLITETLLRESAMMLDKDPAGSMIMARKAVKMFQEIGDPMPDLAKTVLSQSLARQIHGVQLGGSSGTVQSMSVGNTGRWLLTVDSLRNIHLWDIFKVPSGPANENGYRIDVSTVPLMNLAISTDEHWVVGARADGAIQIWNMTLERPSDSPIILRDSVPGLRRIEISPDSRWLIAYGNPHSHQQTLQRSGIGEIAQPGSVAQENGMTPKFTASPVPTGQLAVDTVLSQPDKSGNFVEPNGVWLWDLLALRSGNDAPRPLVLRGHETPISCLKISNDSKWLATAAGDRVVRIYDLKSTYPGGNQKVLAGHEHDITDIQFGPDGFWLVTGSRDGNVKVWDLRGDNTSPQAFANSVHEGGVRSLDVSADGKWFASTGYDRKIRLCDAQSLLQGKAIRESIILTTDQEFVQKLAFTHNGASMVALGNDGSIRIWDLASEIIADQALKLNGYYSTFTIGAGSRWLILASLSPEYPGIRLWPLNFNDTLALADWYGQNSLNAEHYRQAEARAKYLEQKLLR